MYKKDSGYMKKIFSEIKLFQVKPNKLNEFEELMKLLIVPLILIAEKLFRFVRNLYIKEEKGVDDIKCSTPF